jgi:tetratricopeptide (TPR) repeat protein
MAPPLGPVRKRRRRRSRPLPLWPLGVLVLIATVTGLVWFVLGRLTRSSNQTLAGYIDSVATLRQEYVHFYNRPLPDPAIERDFQYAAARVARGDYSGAAASLENTAKKAPLPAVFNDLGVVYVKRNDGARALKAFRAALAKDGDYPQVRANLADLESMLNAAEPVTREVEPNDTFLLANAIALGAPVDAEISDNDIDCFRFKAPPAPRDILAVEIENLSTTLMPSFSVFDGSDRFLGWSQDAQQQGASVTRQFSPQPNATLVLHVWGYRKSGGKYRLTVRALRAFDRYEPNDDIQHPYRLALAQTIDANIMDAADTDFYSFVAPDSGTVKIEIHNHSTTLIPALTTFTADQHTTGIGPDLQAPGADLLHTIAVKPRQIYFVQVWSRANSAGAYSLTIQ